MEYFLTPYININSKWVKDLNVRLDIIKFLEENTGRTLFDRNRSNIFLDPFLGVMEVEIKINKLDLLLLLLSRFSHVRLCATP